MQRTESSLVQQQQWVAGAGAAVGPRRHAGLAGRKQSLRRPPCAAEQALQCRIPKEGRLRVAAA